MALADTARLIVELSLTGNLKRGLQDADRQVSKFGGSFNRTQRSLDTFGRNLNRAAVIGAGAFAGAVVGSVKAAADFESSLNTINTIARATPVELAGIGNAIRQVARDSGTPLEELTQGYYDLLSAGVDAAHATDVLTAANTLSIGGLSTAAEAVDLLTTSINTYGGDATQAARHADVFAKAVERGKVTAAEISASFAQVGPLAASMGVEIEELAAGFATLTAAGTPAGEASTQMAAALTALLKTTPGLEQLQKNLGKNYAAIAGNKGLNVALQQLREDADKAGIKLVDLVGRKEALLYILQTTGPNIRKYNADLRAMGDASGTAAEQMAERQQGLNFQLARLKALALDAGITIGNSLLPKLTPLVGQFAAFLSKNQAAVSKFGEDLANAFQEIGRAAQDIPWDSIKSGLSLSFDIAKKAVGLFRSLPPGLQAAAIGLLAVNKLTGGLGTAIIRDVAGLALKSLRTIVAGNVTVIGKSVVGPGLGGGAGGGRGAPVSGVASAGGNKLGTAVRVLGTVALAAGSIVAIKELLDIRGAQSEENERLGRGTVNQATGFAGQATLGEMKASLDGIEKYTNSLNTQLTPEGLAYQMNIDGVRTRLDEVKAVLAGQITAKLGEQSVRTTQSNDRLEAIRNETIRTREGVYASRDKIAGTVVRASQGERSAISRASGQQVAAQGRARAAAFAIRDKLSTLPPAIRAIEHPVTAHVSTPPVYLDSSLIAARVSRIVGPGRIGIT